MYFKESSKTITTTESTTTNSQAQSTSQSTSPTITINQESLANQVTTQSQSETNKSTTLAHQNQTKLPHNSILNRFKQQFESVVSLKNSEKQNTVPSIGPKNETNNAEIQTSPASPTSDMADQSDENQKTMTKKDGIELLEQCRLINCKNKTPERSPESLKTPTDIASKLNDLYFKHLEEENSEQKLENESDIEIDEKLSFSKQSSLTTDDEINSVLFQLPQNTADISGSAKNTFIGKSNTQICLNKHNNIYNNKSSSLCSSPVVVSNLNRSNSGVASVGGSNRNMGVFKTIDHLGSEMFFFIFFY